MQFDAVTTRHWPNTTSSRTTEPKKNSQNLVENSKKAFVTTNETPEIGRSKNLKIQRV